MPQAIGIFLMLVNRRLTAGHKSNYDGGLRRQYRPNDGDFPLDYWGRQCRTPVSSMRRRTISMDCCTA